MPRRQTDPGRRRFLRTAAFAAGGLAGLGLAGHAAGTGESAAAAPAPAGPASGAAGSVEGRLRFPDGFVWGTSSSAYQIEGAAGADGRAPSVWDTFCRIPGKVVNGDTGDVAVDHYHRYLEDVGLMARAGFGAYRFSVSWPRVIPSGAGPANDRGLDFYDRLVDALLARGVDPWACLYHWDLPQALQDKGGWVGREAADRFADYALVVAGRLGDRVKRWAMLNEPSVVAIFGHGLGGHAPGLTGRANWAAAQHHQNLAQGRALAALRETGNAGWRLGTVLSLQPVRPAGGLEANREAAAMWDAVWNRSSIDALFRGHYPDLLGADFEPLIRPGDMEEIRQPIDWLGINYYSRMHQQPDPGGLVGTGFGPAPAGTEHTDMGWPIEPDGLYEQLVELRDRYGNPEVHVAENGASFADWVGPSGKAEDGKRIFFLRDHLAACHRAIAEGCDLRGYLAWTLLDNFEWAEGYRQTFGLVQVDRATMQRRPKASYYWLAEVARSNSVPV